MVTVAGADPNVDRAILVKVGLSQTRGGERDHQFVAVAKMTAARIATAGCASAACSTAGVVPPKDSLVEQLNEFNLESAKIPDIGRSIPVIGTKTPLFTF